jgi:hypothetical protein
MARFRFSIASLLGVVLFVAVGAAALRAATDPWDAGVFGITLLLLLTAVLLAVHRSGRRRAYWTGFALFGGAYLAAGAIPPVESRLPTTKGLAYLDSKVPGRGDYAAIMRAFAKVASPNPVRGYVFSADDGTLVASSKGYVKSWNTVTGKLLSGPNGTSENFLRIGHSLLALALAFLGGHLSSYLHERERARRGDGLAIPPPSPPAASGGA